MPIYDNGRHQLKHLVLYMIVEMQMHDPGTIVIQHRVSTVKLTDKCQVNLHVSQGSNKVVREIKLSELI